jgi:hypothetical protein
MHIFQAALEQEKKDVEEQRNKLYRKLEALSAQGIDIGPNMTVIGPAAHAPEPQGFIMEVRKAVSPPGGDAARKTTAAASALSAAGLSASHSQLAALSAAVNSNTAGVVKKASDLVGGKNQHLLSATNETKGEMLEVKQQIPSKLAKLSLAGGGKSKEKKSTSGGSGGGFRPSISGPLQNLPISNHHHQQQQLQQQQQQLQQQQLLPFKLSESERKSVSPKTGYVKLSSSSFAEERVGRALGRDDSGGVSHARTGSSPAAMSGRPLASSNTLPKTAADHHGGSTSNLLRRTDSPDKQQQPLVQRVNYADSGEEVFFF